MAPSHLHGLNLVYPEPQQPQPYLSDADLLAIPNYPPELSAQLDLWTNLAFQSDEGSSSLSKNSLNKDSPASADDDDEDEEREGPARTEGHENVVTGTVVEQPQPQPQTPQIPTASQFDLMAFLASMGMPPHVQGPNLPAPPPGIAAPSLASILSLYSSQGQSPASSAGSPAAATASSSESASTAGPRAKRARSRKASVVADAAPAPAELIDSLDDYEPNEGALNTPVTPVEDKRRRNTAASARFRAKKKEREAALEKKAKDLEGRVSDLERECEALRRENGWLKGLVVGVTGAGAGAGGMPQPPATVGQKRGRDE